MTEILFDGKPVKKLNIVPWGEDGDFIWLDVELEDGEKRQTAYFKGAY